MVKKLAKILLPIMLLLHLHPLQNLWGHDFQERFIQHQLQVQVSPINIDLHLELGFFGDRAAQERLLMDLDSNGQINLNEESTYLRRLVLSIRNKIYVKLGKHRLPTPLLFYPKMNLIINRDVKPLPLKITVSFFARTPSPISPKIPLIIENRVFKNQPAVHNVIANGTDGMHVRLDPIQNYVIEGTDSVFIFTIHCLTTKKDLG